MEIEKFTKYDNKGFQDITPEQIKINQLVSAFNTHEKEMEKLSEAVKYLAKVYPPMENKSDLHIQDKINAILQ